MGKTTLALAMARHLPGAKVVKLGVHPATEGMDPSVLPLKTPFSEIQARFEGVSFLVIESGSVLDDPDCRPDLVVFLPAPGGDKPGSARRRARSDLIAGRPITAQALRAISDRLGGHYGSLRTALETVGTVVTSDH